MRGEKKQAPIQSGKCAAPRLGHLRQVYKQHNTDGKRCKDIETEVHLIENSWCAAPVKNGLN